MKEYTGWKEDSLDQHPRVESSTMRFGRHYKVKVSIHDNIAVHGVNTADHYENLKNCLERCKEMGIILKPSKSKFCMSRMKWFGRIFTGHGVTADPEKHNSIKEAGPPTSIEDVCSLLMACQFNAKFSFDSEPESYEDITFPLRQLLKKEAVFNWGQKEASAYKRMIAKMNDPSTPYKLSR